MTRSEPFVEYGASPDLAKNVLSVLMKPGATFYHDPELRVPDGFVVADVYMGERERAARLASLARSRVTLAADAAAELPGVPLDAIGQVAIGLNVFVDGIQMFKWTQSTEVNTFAIGISNLTHDVAESSEFIALGGLFTCPKVLRADKVRAAAGDVSMNASPEAVEAAARVTSELYEKVVARPLHAVLTRKNFFGRASSYPGLADFPYQVRDVVSATAGCLPSTPRGPLARPTQYVAFTFYQSNVNADLPEIASLVGIEENRCPFDGTTGPDLATVRMTVNAERFALHLFFSRTDLPRTRSRRGRPRVRSPRSVPRSRGCRQY